MCQFRLIFSSKLNVVSMKWQFFIGHWHCYCYCCCDMYILSTCKCNSLNFYVHLLSSSTHLVVFVYKSRCSWMGFIVFQVTEIVTFTNYSEFSVGLRDSNGVITSRLLSIFKIPQVFPLSKVVFPQKVEFGRHAIFSSSKQVLVYTFPRKGKWKFHPHIYDSWIKHRHVLKLVISRSIYIPRICHIIMLWAWAMRTMSNKPKHPRLKCLSFACIKWVFTFCWLSVCRMPAVDI